METGVSAARRSGAEVLPPMTERQLLAWVVKAAKVFGFLAYHTWTSIRSAAGFPDLVLVNPMKGRVIFAELKRDGGRTTEKQEEWLLALRVCRGVETYLWTPADRDTILEVLRG
jgi:hypothetical protein